MTDTTDPALELAELCDRLHVNSNERGDTFIGTAFGVEPWSAEFLEITHSIVERTVALEALLEGMKINQAVRSGAAAHLAQIRQAFTLADFANPWSSRGQRHVGPEHSSPIRMLSAGIPEQYRYPKLTADEADELIQMVDQLLEWLKDEQLRERDFIRESLIDGLERFRFRLERLEWFGWGFSIQSLRDVILAYLALERGLKPNEDPKASVLLEKVGGLLRAVFKYASGAKDVGETAEWLLGVYRAAVIVAPTATGYVVGYLTHGAG